MKKIFLILLSISIFSCIKTEKSEIPNEIVSLQDQTLDQDHNALQPVRTLVKGTRMTVVEVYGDYIKIGWNKTNTGYVWNPLISSNKGAWTVNGKGATIHSGPATASPGIVLLPAKTPVRIISVYPTWYKVVIRSNKSILGIGWVYAPYNKGEQK